MIYFNICWLRIALLLQNMHAVPLPKHIPDAVCTVLDS